MTREKSLFISLCFFLFLHFLSPDSLSTSLDLCVVKSRGEKPEPAFIEPGFNFFLLFLWGLASGVAFLQVGFEKETLWRSYGERAFHVQWFQEETLSHHGG